MSQNPQQITRVRLPSAAAVSEECQVSWRPSKPQLHVTTESLQPHVSVRTRLAFLSSVDRLRSATEFPSPGSETGNGNFTRSAPAFREVPHTNTRAMAHGTLHTPFGSGATRMLPGTKFRLVRYWRLPTARHVCHIALHLGISEIKFKCDALRFSREKRKHHVFRH